MKLLYLSCHSVLEYDEVKLFKEMGIDVFSHGVYANPNKPSDVKRPAIKGPFDHHLVYMSYRYGKENYPGNLLSLSTLFWSSTFLIGLSIIGK